MRTNPSRTDATLQKPLDAQWKHYSRGSSDTPLDQPTRRTFDIPPVEISCRCVIDVFGGIKSESERTDSSSWKWATSGDSGLVYSLPWSLNADFWSKDEPDDSPVMLALRPRDQQPLFWQLSQSSPSLVTMVVQPCLEKWAQGLSAMESDCNAEEVGLFEIRDSQLFGLCLCS
jgi:hypothetical protein